MARIRWRVFTKVEQLRTAEKMLSGRLSISLVLHATRFLFLAFFHVSSVRLNSESKPFEPGLNIQVSVLF